MAAAQHTPGPWSVEGPDCFGDYNIHCPGERAVVAAVISNVRPDDEVAANARLIAAATELLALLKQALAFMEADSPPCGPGECVGEMSTINLKTDERVEIDLFDLRAAIAKAEGRA